MIWNIIIFAIFLFGTCIGSFLNVVILRMPKGNTLFGRSHCRGCGKKLNFWELVPVLSYLFLRGKCYGCGAQVSARYIFIEIITGFLFVMAYIFYIPQTFFDVVLLLRAFFALGLFIAIFVIDFEHFLILDKIVFFGIGGVTLLNLCLDFYGQIFLAPTGFFISGVLGAVFMTLPIFAIWFFSKGRWMGFGDVKLTVFLGIFFGWQLAILNLVLAIWVGGIFSIFLLLFTKSSLKTKVPLGTFLCFSAVITLFWGKQILSSYLGYLGF